MLEIRGLTKQYGDVQALAGLDLTVGAGEFFTLLGPNGAGKTTTIKILTGLLRPTSGSVHIAGLDLASAPEQAKRLVGYIPDRPYFYEKLTGLEFLGFVADCYGIPQARRDQLPDLLERFSLTPHIHRRIEAFSHGMRQKLAFCACFLPEPQLAIIDEPWVGLDPRSIRSVIAFLQEQSARGTTIFMSTHTLALAQEFSHRTGILHNGRLIALGDIESILSGAHTRHLEQAFLQLTEETAGALEPPA